MFTIKHQDDNGPERLYQAETVSFDRKEGVLVGTGSPGPDEFARKGGVVTLRSGYAYVTNDNGKTVSMYNMRKDA